MSPNKSQLTDILVDKTKKYIVGLTDMHECMTPTGIVSD